MEILEIRKFKDPILKKKCQKVEKIDEEIKKHIFAMVQIMQRNNGIGLAAPQVGILKRIIVFHSKINGNRLFALVNPEIIKMSREREIEEEGCLSFPGIFIKIKRAKNVVVEGLDINGEKVRISAEGLSARVFQHEIDHLNGIIFLKRLGFREKLKMNIKKLLK